MNLKLILFVFWTFLVYFLYKIEVNTSYHRFFDFFVRLKRLSCYFVIYYFYFLLTLFIQIFLFLSDAFTTIYFIYVDHAVRTQDKWYEIDQFMLFILVNLFFISIGIAPSLTMLGMFSYETEASQMMFGASKFLQEAKEVVLSDSPNYVAKNTIYPMHVEYVVKRELLPLYKQIDTFLTK